MTRKAPFTVHGRNPDVLSCIANLSNDEVFTPPQLANRMLDSLADAWAQEHAGENIWARSDVTFLDPFAKSGIFLREITARLTVGLADAIPDLQERVDHVLLNQVFGIAITHLTSLLARRSLYCSKWADGPHSIANCFDTTSGNVWYERTEHTWIGARSFIETSDASGKAIRRGTDGRCKYCGATQRTLDRGFDAESYAYAFIHTDDICARTAELFGDEMQFDVIIGNPPYQLGDGAAGAVPIYQDFVRTAKALAPRYLTMVTPSRWFAGGNNLDAYRAEMLADRRLRAIVDYPISSEVFPGVDVGGGVSYFLWDAAYNGDCEVTTVRGGKERTVVRALDAYDIFVRDSDALSILERVLEPEEPSMFDLVSTQSAFGLPTNFSGYRNSKRSGDLVLHYNGGGRMAVRKKAYISRSQLTRGDDLIDGWKLFVSEAYRIAEKFPNRIVGAPMVAGPGEVCTQTFLVIGCFNSAEEAESAATYYSTRFFRFLLWLRKIGQHASRSVYKWVPMQTWDRKWTDEELYAKYGITAEEQIFIEAMIKPMDLAEDSD